MEDLEQKLDRMEELILMAMHRTNKWGSVKSIKFSKQQYLLLITLDNKKRATVSNLADELNLSPSATTLAINRLVRDGHVARNRDEIDRRVVWVELTPEARVLVHEQRERRRKVLRCMMSSLEPEESEQFITIARKMLTNLQDPI
ncbi:DNA-binding transcriptional regulator, MarR family [Paenibacillus sp. 1_12]|uniref:MarR family winged helix-turn-helix transcriptional regulator n=1 Tax=Paenibacillus sp. 1_12 TaxID=1566278 RepID=UPI0008F10256|nr:MarR family transcriptional regulator [Paenibacillus sp. 1_12]SFK67816.1 DNA-binding transcriptional regulator, MarR family [Paenibacillus sp. 1_12]